MKLSVEKLLNLLPSGKVDRRGKYIRADCPMCSQHEFTISLEDGHKCGCNRKKHCGFSGNIFTLAKALKRFDILNLEGEVGKVEKLENLIEKKGQNIDLDLPTIKMPLGWVREYQNDYLDSRGFDQYERYKVGSTKIHPKLKNNYVIIAVEDEGEIKGYISRHIWDKKKIAAANEIRKSKELPEILRYINSDSDFSKMMAGYDEIVPDKTKTVICVEGIFDKWNIDKILKLHDQEEVKCNATFKCAISIEQIIKWKAKGVENLILFYDPDVVKEIKRVGSDLQLYFNVLIAFNEKGDVDAGDIDEKGLGIVFSNLRSVTDFNTSKVVNKIN